MTNYKNGVPQTRWDKVYWLDQLGAGSSLGVGAAAPQRTKVGSTSYVYTSNYDVGDGFSTEIQFNHDAAQGSVTISPHMHIMLPAAPSSGDYVKFAFDYTFASINGTFTVDPSHDTKEVLLTGKSQYAHLLVEFADIVVTMSLSAILLCGVSRVTTAPNPEYASRMAIIAFDVHYTTDTPGSSEEYIK